jgi:hypothetical protein
MAAHSKAGLFAYRPADQNCFPIMCKPTSEQNLMSIESSIAVLCYYNIFNVVVRELLFFISCKFTIYSTN